MERFTALLLGMMVLSSFGVWCCLSLFGRFSLMHVSLWFAFMWCFLLRFLMLFLVLLSMSALCVYAWAWPGAFLAVLGCRRASLVVDLARCWVGLSGLSSSLCLPQNTTYGTIRIFSGRSVCVFTLTCFKRQLVCKRELHVGPMGVCVLTLSYQGDICVGRCSDVVP